MRWSISATIGNAGIDLLLVRSLPFRSRLNSCIKLGSMPNLKVFLSREQIAKRVAELGEEIARDFHGQSIIFVGVLKGAAIFLSDLARHVPLDATFDFIGVSSYGNRPRSCSKSSKSRPSRVWII